MVRRSFTLVSALCLLGLSACANTKGSWACKAEPGASCSNIATIDANDSVAPGRGKHKAMTVVDNSGPAAWWSQEDARASPLVTGPRREGDQVMRVVIAAWVDAVGDYHAPSEVYGVMRKGGWWTSPPVSALTPALQSTAGAPSAVSDPKPQSSETGASPAAQ
ncbi:MAG: hypothetical protein B7Z26_11985 [Asticcacaulis sp. 32-58-5]|nr:MAG: hypothetical protein B7Z26_11985 [Asticcacaulis sp. 32-58-5]